MLSEEGEEEVIEVFGFLQGRGVAAAGDKTKLGAGNGLVHCSHRLETGSVVIANDEQGGTFYPGKFMAPIREAIEHGHKCLQAHWVILHEVIFIGVHELGVDLEVGSDRQRGMIEQKIKEL